MPHMDRMFLVYFYHHLMRAFFFRSNILLTSAQRSAEVRALQRALSFGVCMSALCGLRFTDFGRVAFSCKQRFQFISISPDKTTKQSRDLSMLFTVKY